MRPFIVLLQKEFTQILRDTFLTRLMIILPMAIMLIARCLL